ncbi:MAG: Holliday junction branch migration protein RuvA [Acidimicrobiales bacterium]
MIGSLRGTVVERSFRRDQCVEVVVEVGGVGYRLIAPARVLGGWAESASEVRVWVHTHVREDAIVLYGFGSRDERSCFEALIGAHGVGPAVALAMLSVHSPADLRRAVAAEDLDALMMVPGIGRKTAARLLVELESRLDTAGADGLVDLPAGTVGAERPGIERPGSEQPGDGPSRRSEVRAALGALGYAPDEIRHAVGRLPEGEPVEEMLRAALRELAGVLRA